MIIRVIKMASAFFISMTLANVLQLNYAPSAGIVGLLTIQNTKKETLTICLKRIASFILSLISAYIVFHLVGYSALSFSIFLVVFVSFSFLLKLEDGLAMNSVITTHYLIEKSMSIEWICNEMMIFGIGIFVGFVINLYTRSNKEKIKQSMYELDETIKGMMKSMSLCLNKETKSGILYDEFDKIFQTIDVMISEVYLDMNNQLYGDSKYELEYLYMRQSQLHILKDIYDLMMKVKWTGKQSSYISEYLYDVSQEFHKDNDVIGLKEKLQELNHLFEKDDLPYMRYEFENRALLYTMMQYISKFLDVKQEFMQKWK